jgi:DNA polymerase III epsilon subunit-like protein
MIELAVLVVDEHLDELARFESLLAVDAPLGAAHVHGITAAELAGAPTFAEVAPRVGTLLAGAIIVGHYPRFDLRFLDAELQRLGGGLPTTGVIDTRETCRAAGILGSLRLVDCCRELGVENDRAHAAMSDVLATRALLATCLARGVHALDHVTRFTARTTTPGWPTTRRGDVLTHAGRAVEGVPRAARCA